jgi:16S rRNA processing protein RimM
LTAAEEERNGPHRQEPAAQALSAGRVGRAHGLDGSFYVTRPRPRLLGEGTTVAVGGEQRRIVRRAGTEQRPILRLEEVASREAAEELRGLELTVAAASAPRLDQDEWWAHELEGCEVRDGERVLGTVVRMIELPSCEALEVRPVGGGDAVLVPMVRDAIRAIEPKQGRIDVNMSFLGLDDA